ncbi:MAG: sensor histidine kinase [Thomasclavelia sp.]|uniref:sensor histidine kinase n=1 Tax=Thomasclavelia sp. TaxID=3025757 RepID=UPI0039A2E43C
MVNKIRMIIKDKQLFIKISVITAIGVIIATFVVSLFVIQISEDVYLEAYNDSNEKIITQIRDDYYNLHEDVVKVLTVCQNSNSLKEYLINDNLTSNEESNVIYKMKEQLNNYGVLHNNTASNLLLVGFNGKTYFPNNNAGVDNYQDIINSKVVKKALKNPSQITYQYAKDGFSKTLKNDNVIVAIKILKESKAKDPYGLAIIMIEQNDFSYFYNSLIDDKVNHIAIVSQDEKIISSNNDKVGTNNKLIKTIIKQKDKKHQKIDNRNYTVTIKNLPFMDGKFISLIDETNLINQINYLPPVLLMSIFISIIFVTIIILLIRKTFEPLNAVITKIPEITKGNFDNHIEVTGNGEIKELGEGFNYMIDGLNDYVKRVVKLQEEKRLTEIHALQMQINPHFVYNTLTSIKFLVWQGNKDLAIEAIDAFIMLLRNTLSNKNEYVTINDEILNIKNYIKLQNIRYNNKIAVTYDISDSCKHLMIVKMLLQPFVENAFFHAFNNQDNGTIKIFVRVIKDNLMIEIIDNGLGMEQEKINNLLNGIVDKGKNFSGLGVKNVNDRIKLLYGNDYGVKISSVIDQGTIISISLPIIVD